MGRRERTTDVSVVIVTYGVRQLLLRCLDSLPGALAGLSADVWVVDNGSTDGTWDALAGRPDVRALRGSRSLGYARGNNLGLRHAQGRHVLFLNPDTELPSGAIGAMLTRLEADRAIGILGPRLVLPDGSLDPSARRDPPTALSAAIRLLRLPPGLPVFRGAPRYNLTELPEDQEAFVGAVSGACMLLRGDALAAVGGFDPGYFMYGEDLDLAERVRLAGWGTLYFPAVRVRHWKRQSSRQRELRTRFEFYRAMWRYYHRHQRGDPLIVRGLVSAAILGIGTGALLRRAAARLGRAGLTAGGSP